jgi:BirA family biotin operon repressor/biotin-[acetyl-CoA-carboxylase] ligase
VDLLRRLDGAYAELLAAPAAIWQRWRATLDTLGRRVSVHAPGGRTIAGLAEDVDAAGALLVRDDRGTLHTLHAGDVTLARADGTMSPL